MATIIFDFDHTLFNTRDFKDTIDSLLLKHADKQALEEAEKSYRKANFNNYDFKGHVDEIRKLGLQIDSAIFEQFDGLDLKKHLKGSVAKVITNLKASGHKTILLTKGTEEFQNIKLERSGVKEIFGSDIVICRSNKEKIIGNIEVSGNVYIFNDNVDETLEIQKHFPNIKYVVCKRPDLNLDYEEVAKMFEVIDSIDYLEDLIK